MPDLRTKKILYINLRDQSFEMKAHDDYWHYLGGVGLGAKILASDGDRSTVVFSTGPLNGFFPFASKTSVLYRFGPEIKDVYLGGSLSWRMRFAGIDAISIVGKSKDPLVLDILDGEIKFRPADVDLKELGLPGKKSTLEISKTEDKMLLDGYFEPGDQSLANVLKSKNVAGVVVTGAKDFDIESEEKFQTAYDTVLARIVDMEVEKGGNPSCSGCPMGCDKSKVGEVGGDFLVHSLVGCTFASKIYSDTNVVFACLNALGYGYTHEEIEECPGLVSSLMEELRGV